ncbi:MAG: hypothetical protein CSA20_01695 [Deltaproteobacteria bacterium]|nr:MAG: hypothetical protein CSA20_01695 [Deltaproteobacteria bacterium]
MRWVGWICILVMMFLVAPVLGNAAEKVTAKGVAFYEPGQEALARERALEQAKRQALEQAIGVKIHSDSVVKNYQTVRDEIISHSQGYLKKVNILEEGTTSYGAFQVTIEAEIETTALAGDIDLFHRMFMLQKNPRIMTCLAPKLPDGLRPLALNARNTLNDLLLKNGFVVLAPDTLQSDHGVALIAELVLDKSSTTSTYQDVTMQVNEVQVSVQVKRAGDETVLATSSARKTLPGDNRLAALDKGVKHCVLTLWKDLRRKLTKVWHREVTSVRTLTVEINNVKDFKMATGLGDRFKAGLSSVRAVTLLTMKKNTALYSIKYAGYPETFAAELGLAYFKAQYADVSIVSIKDNAIVLTNKTQ